MNFSFVIKSIILSFFIFIIIYSISCASTGKIQLNGNNFGVKNVVKESLNIGELRASGEVTYDENKLIESTINNYIKNNPTSLNDVEFDISLNSNIVTIKIVIENLMFNSNSKLDSIFSYEVLKK
ncbi:MAG: hypothetical protein PHX40_00065 [Bacilli bacterium]|nr:hypothetical protein [Bacilli bacterium]